MTTNNELSNNDPIIESMTAGLSFFKTKDCKKAKKKLNPKEKKFRNSVDEAFKIAMFTFTTLVSASAIFCPPLAYFAALMLIITTLLHYYDAKHNYVISHFIKNFMKKIKKSIQSIRDNDTDQLIDKELANDNNTNALVINNKASDEAVKNKKQEDITKFATNLATFFNNKTCSKELAKAAKVYAFCRKFN